MSTKRILFTSVALQSIDRWTSNLNTYSSGKHSTGRISPSSGAILDTTNINIFTHQSVLQEVLSPTHPPLSFPHFQENELETLQFLKQILCSLKSLFCITNRYTISVFSPGFFDSAVFRARDTMLRCEFRRISRCAG